MSRKRTPGKGRDIELFIDKFESTRFPDSDMTLRLFCQGMRKIIKDKKEKQNRKWFKASELQFLMSEVLRELKCTRTVTREMLQNWISKGEFGEGVRKVYKSDNNGLYQLSVGRIVKFLNEVERKVNKHLK